MDDKGVFSDQIGSKMHISHDFGIEPINKAYS